jgi:2-amino-4-hydroxy-6-hydroxymethyldihydropteridine diphosphokinase
MSIPAWIGLGSNLGDRRGILNDAVDDLAVTPGVIVRAVSSYHETKPVGGPPGQGPFLNAAAYVDTTLDPHQLLEALQRIEKQAGRVREVRWGERTLDLDLLYFGHEFLDTEELKIPHPRVAVRRFVLGPLAEIAPNYVAPIMGRRIASLLADLDRKPRLIAIDGSKRAWKAAIFDRLVEELPAFGISEADLAPSEEAEADEDPYHVVFQSLERKTEALKASRWAVETLRVPWIAADFCLDAEVFRAHSNDPRKDQRPSNTAERFNAHLEWKRRITGLSSIAMPPTFVVILAPDRDPKWRSGISSPSLLWTESDNPEGIVAEVIATCRGIEGV